VSCFNELSAWCKCREAIPAVLDSGRCCEWTLFVLWDLIPAAWLWEYTVWQCAHVDVFSCFSSLYMYRNLCCTALLYPCYSCLNCKAKFSSNKGTVWYLVLILPPPLCSYSMLRNDLAHVHMYIQRYIHTNHAHAAAWIHRRLWQWFRGEMFCSSISPIGISKYTHTYTHAHTQRTHTYTRTHTRTLTHAHTHTHTCTH